MIARLAPLIVVALIASLYLSCGGTNEPQVTPSRTPVDTGPWEQVAPETSGAFPAAPGSFDQPLWQPDMGMFPQGLTPIVGFNDELWMISQTLSFSSTDGLNWTQHTKTDPGSLLSPNYTFFDNKLWMFGGMKVPVSGYANVVPSDFQDEIWTSADGSSWEVAGTAAWPARKGTTVVPYQGKLWLFGGSTSVDEHGAPDQFLNDVWTSTNGIDWTEVTDAAPWPAQEYPGIVVFNNALYLVGLDRHAEVWSSVDGKNWLELTAQAAWGSRFGYGSVAFDGKLWVYGGCAGEDCRIALNDVWYSSDGKTWTKQADHAPWSERSAANTIVFQNMLWIFSGKHTGDDPIWQGDIWVMNPGA